MSNKGTLQSKEETKTEFEPEAVKAEMKRANNILDSKYEKSDLYQIVNDGCKHLSHEQRNLLLWLLLDYEHLFDGTLGTWNTEPAEFELQEEARPVFCKPFQVPQVYKAPTKKECERLCSIGVLEQVTGSEWGFPLFIIPKKDGRVRFVSDLRKLNTSLKCKPFPLPKIMDLMQKLEGFQWATALDLNMGYYHIKLGPKSQDMCTIVFPWGCYRYKRLAMGVCVAPDIFQEKISTLMYGQEFVRTYLDDLLCLTVNTFEEHINKLRLVLQRISDAGLKINATKSTFCATEIEYLGYWITHQGVQPLPKKVQGMINIKPPTTRKQLRRFIGMVNYQRQPTAAF